MSCDAFCLAAPEAEGEHPEAESRSRVESVWIRDSATRGVGYGWYDTIVVAVIGRYRIYLGRVQHWEEGTKRNDILISMV